MTRAEFVAEQTAHAQKLRDAILADHDAPAALAVLAADEAQWTAGWLDALESAGLLRPEDEAPPIRDNPKVVSLNATLASGILLAKGGENYRTQNDLLGFFAKVQAWYGDTARYAGDPASATAPVEYLEHREDDEGNSADIPVPALADPAAFDAAAAHATHFLNFNVFAGGKTELEYLRHIGVLDDKFQPVAAQALSLSQYLQQAAQQNADADALVAVRGPQAALAADGKGYVPAATPLPYSISFNNPAEHAVGQIRLVSELDADLDPRSVRLGDLKIGDINVHLPGDRASFQGDFDFTASRGFILRVSAGIDAETRIATWLLQAIDPDTGEVITDTAKGLLAPSSDPSQAGATQLKRGFASYTVRSSDIAQTGAAIETSARIFLDETPPVDSAVNSVTLDAAAPTTTVAVTALGADAQGAPSFDVQWQAQDDASGVKYVTVYVAENGGDFKIWQRQVPPQQSQAIFTGEAGKRYEFLAVAVDIAGNREAASTANAVLPDDGSRQAVLDALGVNETVTQTAEMPLATQSRSDAANELFAAATLQLPGAVAPQQPGDLRSVLDPFTLRGFADGFDAGASDVGALAMVELADQTVLASAGPLRNQVFAYPKEGGRSVTPLFTRDEPVLDMALDGYGHLWVMTGRELLQVDAATGDILQRLAGPNGDPLTHALAIQPGSGDIYVSSGNGIEIFHPGAADAAHAWTHFSNQRVGDLAFGPDGRLWAVAWSGSDITAAKLSGSTDIVSFPMDGRNKGRAELEYRLSGAIDSIAFGAAGTELQGLLIVSSNLQQRPVVAGDSDVPHQSSVWMVELQSRRILQLASGGTRGESVVATQDGRILIAQTGHIDEIAPRRTPNVTALSVADGALVPLPVGQIGVSFDQAMWLGDAGDASSVLNPQNFTLTALGSDAGRVFIPQSIRWDAASRTAWLDVNGLLPAGQYQLDISANLRSSTQVRLEQGYVSTFTALLDMTSQLQLDFSNTRADRASGEVSYDVSITNIGTDDLNGPLLLLLDPGRYFDGGILDAANGGGDQSDLWILDVSAGLWDLGGKLAVGATLANQTVTLVPASRFATLAGMADLVKANLGHGVYAMPQPNLPPLLSVAGAYAIDADTFEPASVGQPWSGQLEAIDADGTQFFFELLQAPAGVTLTSEPGYSSDADGYYHAFATLNWTPAARDPADTEIVVRVQDSRGGIATKRFHLPLNGGNHAPSLFAPADLTLQEGEALSLPISAGDADGNPITLTLRNLPAGAVFDAATGLLNWLPGYDQAGRYEDITVIASDGKSTVVERFNLTVEQGFAQPVLGAVAPQTLREGEGYALQLAGSVPGGLVQADGTTISLEYAAPWLPGGATLNRETGWLQWTPGYNQHGEYRVPVTLTATYTPPNGEVAKTRITRDIVFNVLNANGAPVFDALETWNLLEGQPLRLSVFAYDPDNPDFEPKIRLNPLAPASGSEGSAATVSYQVGGLPEGATFDAETLEILWTPGYAQAGSYQVSVTATDTGDGTGTPAVSHLVIPIIVANANQAPQIGDINNAFVDKGAVLEIPVEAWDADGNPLQLTVSGLPRFASYVQELSENGHGTGKIRFAPGEGDRGDYTITVVAQDDGDINQVQVQAKSFVLTVRSVSEAPVITAPKQVVAVVGQAVSLPIGVSDLDQDALSYSAEGLPIGAELVQQSPYGHLLLNWTPTLDDLGSRDITLAVTDQGLPPQDAGYSHPDNPVPNTSYHTLRLIVRDANAVPQLLGVQVDGQQVTDIGADTPIQVNATEGVALSIDLFGRDGDADLIDWRSLNLPRGMSLEVPAAGQGNRAVLRWTPDYFAAQSDNLDGTSPGSYRFSVTAGDGAAQFSRSFEVRVVNVNQAPVLLAMPLQLVSEGDTLGFTLRGADADGDALALSFLHDDTTPEGVFFDPASGYLEWTPNQSVVDNAQAQDRAFNFSFRVSDGQASATQTVQVRVFDVNRAPRLAVSNHAVVVGQALSLPVQLGLPLPVGEGWGEGSGIYATDPDGAAQTQALSISFTGLPEGAVYDAQSRRLQWTPGPGQIGDFTVTAQAFDGKNRVSRSFTLQVVADEAANAPKILVSTTPSTPAVPGQTVVATVRADAYSPIANLSVQVRGEGLGSDQWQTVALDGAGRLRLVPSQPGLIELRVTATDRDGFSATTTHTVRVKDPADKQAPLLAWGGSLAGRDAWSQPIDVSQATSLQAALQERQLLGYRLQIAPADSGAWTTLAAEDTAAAAVDGLFAFADLDPAQFANGVYQLRLTAWDISGRTTEIAARVIIDTADKQIAGPSATDGIFSLAGHSFALNRGLGAGGQGLGTEHSDFGNWGLPLLDIRLTCDQPATTAGGMTAPWQEGARVWLQIPENFSDPAAAPRYLSFSLSTSSEKLGTAAGAPQVWHPTFGDSQGWSLQAHSEPGNNDKIESLDRQGLHLYDHATGLPWRPAGYTLTGPDGTRYELDAQGKISQVAFSDGVQWLVTDAGIAAVTGQATERLDFLRDSQGRIVRVTGPLDSGSIAYRYDAQGRLILAHPLNLPQGEGEGNAMGTPYGYDAQGRPYADTLTANLGAAVNWNGASTANQWSGSLAAGETVSLAYSVRQSELNATVKVPGAQGAVILAVENETSDPDASLEFVGATVVGRATQNGKQTTLIRVSEAGLKRIRLTGQGTAAIRISLAGDLNRDGFVDGQDSQAWEQAATLSPQSSALSPVNADLNGDGQANATDRQVLYANYGWRANQAPVALSPQSSSLSSLLTTHTDLSVQQSLASIAEDLEGEQIFWRILNASHGTASLSRDGQSLLFTPEAGYSGPAAITLQADDGFAAAAPIELNVNVSGAKLLAIHLAPIAGFKPGQIARLQASGDFEDGKGVNLSVDGSYLTATAADLTGMGQVGSSPVQVDDAQDSLRVSAQGPALVIVTRRDSDGRTVQAVAAVNAANPSQDGYERDPLTIQPDVYPGTLALTPGGTRQLKVHLLDPNTGEQTDVHTASQVTFAGTPEQVFTYLDPATQLPLLDPVTGEYQYDPVTGELLLDPNTGETVTEVIPAVLEVKSGTRYLVSDESIATVSADGLITALRSGQVTISIVHLVSSVDASGQMTEQVIGQTDVKVLVQAAQLTDDDETTTPPRAVSVTKDVGGIVSTDTGETVLIGAGALKSDTPVSIRRLDVANLEAITGMAPPAAGVMEAVGAFKLDVGDTSTTYPLQLAIPLQAGTDVQAGDEVLFFHKGQVPSPDASFQPTWWLVDNGYIGSDGIARTASPPYDGADCSGEYVVCKRLPGIVGSKLDLLINAGDWMSFGGMGFCLGGGLGGFKAISDVLGTLAAMADNLTGGSYRFGIPQFVTLDVPQVSAGEIGTIKLDEKLLPTPTPWGNVVLPNITAASMEGGKLKLTVSNSSPGQFAGTMVVRALLPDGSHKDIQNLSGTDSGMIEINLPDNLAVGSARWQVVRLISAQQITGSGTLAGLSPLEFAGNSTSIVPKPNLAAVMTRTGIAFYREGKLVAETSLLEKLGTYDFAGDYITGNKVQPIVFTDDLTRVYVGGKGKVYVIDTLTFNLIGTIDIAGGGKNLTSLATVGNMLFIGEGQSYGSGVSQSRLLVMDITPGSNNYKKQVVLQGTGIENSTYGVTGMAIGPDGKTLVVSVPRNPNSVTLGSSAKRGDILVFDLATLKLATGQIDAPKIADLPNDGISGKAGQTITTNGDPNRFLVANIADYDRGLSTLTITRDAQDKITAAKMSTIRMNQPSDAIRVDRLDVQRAQSAVLVAKDGVQYAIVADDNYHFLDPYWKAMYEAPMFTQVSPFGPPMAVGGSASAMKVAVGGKLGIVKDPFGLQGEPQFLGATLPLDGYGIVNLSLSQDGKVLIGQLKGGYGGNIMSSESFTQKPNQNHVWDVDSLLEAALAMPEEYRLSKHIKVNLAQNAEQLLPAIGSYEAAPAGTEFEAAPAKIAVEGRPGDINGIDVKKLIQQKLGISDASQLQKFSISSLDLQTIMNDTENVLASGFHEGKVQFVMNAGGSGQPTLLSRQSLDGNAADASFAEAGILFAYRNITDNESDQLLRSGLKLSDQSRAVVVHYEQKVGGIWQHQRVELTIHIEDAPTTSSLFFGDRPLDNPGYSAMALKSTVAAGANNDRLDVFKVEQRLKYFGYGLSSLNGSGSIKVDGKFESREGVNLWHFDQITQGKNGLEGTITPLSNYSSSSTDLMWLNAYNAPHWMQMFANNDIKLRWWDNKQTGSATDSMGVSWVYDLMLAGQNAAQAQERNKLWFKGTGSLGVMLNLGINDSYVSNNNKDRVHDKDIVAGLTPTKVPSVIATPSGQSDYANRQWNYENATALSNFLLNPSLNNFDSVTGVVGSVSSNARGVNKQNEAFLDFISIYSSVRNDSKAGNASLDEQISNISNINKQEIQKALFGDGGQNGGLISVTDLRLGGKGLAVGVGAVVEPGSLGITSAGVPQALVEYAWDEFQINTPQRISAFLSQSAEETTWFAKLRENFKYTTPSVLADTFKASFQYSNKAGAVNDGYRDPNRSREENASAYLQDHKPASGASDADWVVYQHDLANRVLSTDYGNGVGGFKRDENKIWDYIGRGYIQITGKANYDDFISYLGANPRPGLPTAATVASDHDLIATNVKVAAYSSGRYWNMVGVNALADSAGLYGSYARQGYDPITLAVNGNGMRGAADRFSYFERLGARMYANGNPYESMRGVLYRLGIESNIAAGYQDRFGIVLKTRVPREIDSTVPQNLMASANSVSVPSVVGDILDEVQAEFDIQSGDIAMFDMLMLVVPGVEPQSAPMVLQVSSSESHDDSARGDVVKKVFGICQFMPALSGQDSVSGVYYELVPNDFASDMGRHFSDVFVDLKEGSLVTVLQAPKHGSLSDNYLYTPDQGYLGNDSVVFVVKGINAVDNKLVEFRLVYHLKMTAEDKSNYIKSFDGVQNKYCPTRFWRISSLGNNGETYASDYANNILDMSRFGSMLTFNDLAGSAIAQTLDLGDSTSITLDTAAAGHGWFIDYTPYLNEEFLPTADPNEWVAKPGSAAEGKMDLLSVVWHEYGHALGLDHSADPHDFMGATLATGVRRTLTAEETAKLRDLLLASNTVPDNGPDAPFPYSVLPGFVRLNRARNSRSSGASSGQDNVPQYQAVANTTLTNGDLNAADGWAVRGSVDIAKGAAVLKETSTSQTRLNQVFLLSENDRFISFTLDGIALDDQTAGPDDAFEVGLLNANTGSSLAGPISLGRTDALLNLQANGRELLAQGITRRDNPDGSRTYLIDVRDVPAGTAANLSFDLIGFGGSGSQVTVRDARLIGWPQPEDDTATTAEDAALLIDAAANDIDADQTGFNLAVVAAPLHGQVNVEPDGTFRYVPEADYFGTDSFTYQFTNGLVDSNIATVSLTITPVNDVPTALALDVATAEDAPLVLDLLAQAGDVEGSPLTVAIVTGPAHGTLSQTSEGIWLYTPQANYNGPDSFTYQVNDGKLDSNLATVNLAVIPANDAPVAGNQNLVIDEDTALIGSLLATAVDIDSADLTASVVTGPSHGQLLIDADGSFVYTPDADYNGTDNFSYRVKDEELESAIATLTVTILPVNDAPVLHDLALSTPEDTPLSLDLRAQGNDVDGDALSVTIILGPAYGLLALNADGTWGYTPNPDYNGPDSFVYRVSDGRLDSNPATVTLNVAPVNDAPVAYDSTATAIEDTPYVFRLADFDVFDVDGDALTLTLTALPLDGQLQFRDGAGWNAVALNQSFTAADIAAGALRFVPDANGSGGPAYTEAGFGNQKAHYASFNYVACDGQLESAAASVILDVLPSADAPLLSISASGNGIGASREIFRTGWEEAGEGSYNNSPVSTLVLATTLEGWNLVLPPDTKGGQKAFEIWSEGDLMHDTHGRPQTVHASSGRGNWLELNDARGQGHQTLGIERSVTTRLGATYTLNLDYAGRIGYSAAYTQIGVYVDGIRIGGYAGTSPETALDWKNLQFHFAGTGKTQTIRIVSEATQFDANGRGAMLDNLVLGESLPIDTGYEDGPIHLAAITAALADTDGSEALIVTISALPIGSILSDGTHNFTATQDNTTADITGWNLTHLSLIPPQDYYGILHLGVSAAATETATGAITTTNATLAVVVLPVNDAPQVLNASYSPSPDGTTLIDFASLVADIDGSSLALTFTQPAHGILSRNADGTYTYFPEDGYSGEDCFTYTVWDGEYRATATITLGTATVPSTSKEGCIVIRSTLPAGSTDTLSLGTTPPPPVAVDWDGLADLPYIEQEVWIADFLGLTPEQLSLAEQTGLVVRVNR